MKKRLLGLLAGVFMMCASASGSTLEVWVWAQVQLIPGHHYLGETTVIYTFGLNPGDPGYDPWVVPYYYDQWAQPVLAYRYILQYVYNDYPGPEDLYIVEGGPLNGDYSYPLL